MIPNSSLLPSALPLILGRVTRSIPTDVEFSFGTHRALDVSIETQAESSVSIEAYESMGMSIKAGQA
jgi:hypothetical protein